MVQTSNSFAEPQKYHCDILVPYLFAHIPRLFLSNKVNIQNCYLVLLLGTVRFDIRLGWFQFSFDVVNKRLIEVQVMNKNKNTKILLALILLFGKNHRHPTSRMPM